MTRFLLFLLVTFLSTVTFGQYLNCFSDTSSNGGQILQRLSTYGRSGFSMTVKKTGKKYQGYRICEHNYLQIDSLNQILNDSQIDSLFNCDNGSIKIVAFILFSKRHNDKENVLMKLKEILTQEYIAMASSCSDAIQITSLGRVSYDLLTKTNFLFKPNFKLTKEDKALIDFDLNLYEQSINSN